jgi:excisionase family DNA binding protein
MAEQAVDIADLEWLTAREAAQESPYTYNSIRQFINRGTLPAVRRGYQWYVHRDDLNEYVERMREAGSQKFTPKTKRADTGATD